MRPRKQSFDILQIVGNIRIGVDVFRRNEQWLFHDGQMMPIQRSGSKGVNGYVHNEGGKDSQILNLTVEEYHDQEGLFMDDRQTPRAESAPEIH